MSDPSSRYIVDPAFVASFGPIPQDPTVLLRMTPSTILGEAEVQRIAVAVADELERRAEHPLRVTAADRRRWLGR